MNRSFALTKGFFVKYLVAANDYSISKEKRFLSPRDVREHLFHPRRQLLWNCNGRDVRRSRWQTTLGLTGKYRTTTWQFGETSKTIAPVERIKREKKIGSSAKTAEYNVRVYEQSEKSIGSAFDRISRLDSETHERTTECTRNCTLWRRYVLPITRGISTETLCSISIDVITGLAHAHPTTPRWIQDRSVDRTWESMESYYRDPVGLFWLPSFAN